MQTVKQTVKIKKNSELSITLPDNIPEDELLEVVIIYDYKKKANDSKKYSIKDLKGLGKDIWKDVDADEYVNKERESW